MIPPAVALFEQLADRTLPPAARATFEERLGPDPKPEALAALRRAVTLWTSHGYNITNIEGILDWTQELLAGRTPEPLTKKRRSAKSEPAGFQALRDAGLNIPKDEQ